jgi:MOSC domain-containing protein YiiM
MGELLNIFISESTGGEILEKDSAEITIGGIKGDRYFSESSHREAVTLIESEAVSSLNTKLGADKITAELLRRNLLVKGVSLNDLVGKTFRVGDVVLQGEELADPCSYLEKLTEISGLKIAMDMLGGLRARVIHAGTVRVGDSILTEEQF